MPLAPTDKGGEKRAVAQFEIFFLYGPRFFEAYFKKHKAIISN